MPYKDKEKQRIANREANRRYREKNAGTVLTARGWACIAWEESAPGDFIDRLEEGHVQVLVSPLQDMDTDREGNPEKPHWHVMAMFDYAVPERAAQELFASAGIGITAAGELAPAERLFSIRNYARYLVHMDEKRKPWKHRYDERDVTELCGADWAAVALEDADSDAAIIDEIEEFIETEGYDSYRLLLRYARAHRPDWCQVIRRKTIHLKGYVQSYAYDVSCYLTDPPEGSPAWRRQHMIKLDKRPF